MNHEDALRFPAVQKDFDYKRRDQFDVDAPRGKMQLAALMLPTVLLVDGVSRADKLLPADVKQDKPVLFILDIPMDEHYSSYEVSSLDPAGKQAGTMPTTARSRRPQMNCRRREPDYCWATSFSRYIVTINSKSQVRRT